MVKRINGVEYSGPFFEGDPAKRLRANMRDAVQQIVEHGGATMRGQYPPGRGSGIAGTIRAEMREGWKEGFFGVVYSTMSTEQRERSYVTWMERGRRRHDGVTVDYPYKGFGMWSKVRSALRRAAKITAEQLTKGVA